MFISKSDVVSLLTGHPPFEGKDNFELFDRISYADITLKPTLFKDTSELGKNFILTCLDRNIDSRPSAIELQKHEWFFILHMHGSSDGCKDENAQAAKVSSKTVDRLKSFAQKSSFRQLCLEVTHQ